MKKDKEVISSGGMALKFVYRNILFSILVVVFLIFFSFLLPLLLNTGFDLPNSVIFESVVVCLLSFLPTFFAINTSFSRYTISKKELSSFFMICILVDMLIDVVAYVFYPTSSSAEISTIASNVQYFVGNLSTIYVIYKANKEAK